MNVRPIVSTIDSPTANVSAFLDHYLKLIMKQLPAYLSPEDTTQFLNKLTNIRVRPWLVTVNINYSILTTQ